MLESELGDLDEIQFDRRCPSEDADQDLDLALFGVDFLNRAVEICKGPVYDPYSSPVSKKYFGCGFNFPASMRFRI